jgi:hypothetical protein
MNKYFKFPAESNLGIGVQYIEFNDSGWAVRQVECYEGRWFNSSKSYHEELTSSSLCDQKLTESGIKLGDPVDAQEFEAIWNLSSKKMEVPYLIGNNRVFHLVFPEELLNLLESEEERMRFAGKSQLLITLFYLWNLQGYLFSTIRETFLYYIWQKGRTGGQQRTDVTKLENARVLYKTSYKTAADVCEVAGIGMRVFFAYMAEKRSQERV